MQRGNLPRPAGAGAPSSINPQSAASATGNRSVTNDWEGIDDDDNSSIDDEGSVAGTEPERKSVRIGPRSVAKSVTGSIYSDTTRVSSGGVPGKTKSKSGSSSVGPPKSILKNGPRSIAGSRRSQLDDERSQANRSRRGNDTDSVSSSESSKLSSVKGSSVAGGSISYPNRTLKNGERKIQNYSDDANTITQHSVVSKTGKSIANSKITASKSKSSKDKDGRPKSRDSDRSSVSSSGSSRGSISSKRGPPKDGPCLSGAFFGIPKTPDTQGSVLISGDAGEFWIRIRNFGCYNVSKDDFTKTFFFFSNARSPSTINPSIAVRMLTPSYVVDEGSIPPPPPRDKNGDLMTTDMNFCLTDCINQRTKKAVDPRKFQSLVVAVVRNANEPASVLGCANLADALNDKAEQMADRIDKMRRKSLELQTFGKKVVEQQSIYGKTYQEMDSIATDCFATLGKTKTKGSLTFGEFKLILAVLGVTFTEARAYLWFDKADADGSGEIEFLEFQHLLFLVSHSEPSNFTSLRDVYYFLTNTRVENKDDENVKRRLELEEQQAKINKDLGIETKVESQGALSVKNELPKCDALTLQVLLNALGFVTTRKSAIKLVVKAIKTRRKERQGGDNDDDGDEKFEDPEEKKMIEEAEKEAARKGGKAYAESREKEEAIKKQQIEDGYEAGEITFDEVRDIWLGLCDPRKELSDRGLSIDFMVKEGIIRDPNNTKSLRSYLRSVVIDEEKRILNNLIEAINKSENERILFRDEQLRKRKETLASIDKDESKKTKRIKALLDREDRLRLEKLEKEEKHRKEQEAILSQQLEIIVSDQAIVIQEQKIEEVKAIEEKKKDERKRLNLDVLDLSSKGLIFLPDMMWESIESKEQLPHIVTLDLSKNRISKLPGRGLFGQLSKIWKLDVSSNELKELPVEIGLCSELKVIYAHGNVLRNVPVSFGGLTELVKITLNSNEIEDIPEASLQKMISLQSLHLGSNKIALLPASLGRLESLLELIVNNNRLTFLPPEIGQLKNLRKLDVSSNTLRELPESIGKLVNLTHLILSHNNCRTLPDSLGSGCKKLLYLDAARNRLKYLPTTLGKLQKLLSLNLCDNALRLIDENAFNGLRHLQKLDLSKNRLSLIPSTIGRLIELQALDMSNNVITTVPYELCALRSLRYLDMHVNCLGLNSDTVLPPAIGTLQELEWIDLSCNTIEAIQPGIRMCPRLKHLNLSNNMFKEYPEDVAGIPSLLTLDLSNNKLQFVAGTIGECSLLTALDLSCNELQRIPDSICNMSNLRHLHVYNNRLHILPFSIAWLIPQLMSFDVGKNPLGNLPHKFATQETYGARDVLAIRFAREKRDPILIEVKRARARQLLRILMGMRAEFEDKQDYERVSMLREDHRMLSKGPRAVRAEVNAFTARKGWARNHPGAEKDNLADWVSFIKSELGAKEAAEKEDEKRRIEKASRKKKEEELEENARLGALMRLEDGTGADALEKIQSEKIKRALEEENNIPIIVTNNGGGFASSSSSSSSLQPFDENDSDEEVIAARAMADEELKNMGSRASTPLYRVSRQELIRRARDTLRSRESDHTIKSSEYSKEESIFPLVPTIDAPITGAPLPRLNDPREIALNTQKADLSLMSRLPPTFATTGGIAPMPATMEFDKPEIYTNVGLQLYTQSLTNPIQSSQSNMTIPPCKCNNQPCSCPWRKNLFSQKMFVSKSHSIKNSSSHLEYGSNQNEESETDHHSSLVHEIEYDVNESTAGSVRMQESIVSHTTNSGNTIDGGDGGGPRGTTIGTESLADGDDSLIFSEQGEGIEVGDKPRRARKTARHRHMFEARQSMIVSSSRPGRPGSLINGRARKPGEAAALLMNDKSTSMNHQDNNSNAAAADDDDKDDKDIPIPLDESGSHLNISDGGISLIEPLEFGNLSEMLDYQRAYTIKSLELSAHGRESELLLVPDEFIREGQKLRPLTGPVPYGDPTERHQAEIDTDLLKPMALDGARWSEHGLAHSDARHPARIAATLRDEERRREAEEVDAKSPYKRWSGVAMPRENPMLRKSGSPKALTPRPKSRASRGEISDLGARYGKPSSRDGREGGGRGDKSQSRGSAGLGSLSGGSEGTGFESLEIDNDEEGIYNQKEEQEIDYPPSSSPTGYRAEQVSQGSMRRTPGRGTTILSGVGIPSHSNAFSNIGELIPIETVLSPHQVDPKTVIFTSKQSAASSLFGSLAGSENGEKKSSGNLEADRFFTRTAEIVASAGGLDAVSPGAPLRRLQTDPLTGNRLVPHTAAGKAALLLMQQGPPLDGKSKGKRGGMKKFRLAASKAAIAFAESGNRRISLFDASILLLQAPLDPYTVGTVLACKDLGAVDDIEVLSALTSAALSTVLKSPQDIDISDKGNRIGEALDSLLRAQAVSLSHVNFWYDGAIDERSSLNGLVKAMVKETVDKWRRSIQKQERRSSRSPSKRDKDGGFSSTGEGSIITDGDIDEDEDDLFHHDRQSIIEYDVFSSSSPLPPSPSLPSLPIPSSGVGTSSSHTTTNIKSDRDGTTSSTRFISQNPIHISTSSSSSSSTSSPPIHERRAKTSSSLVSSSNPTPTLISIPTASHPTAPLSTASLPTIVKEETKKKIKQVNEEEYDDDDNYEEEEEEENEIELSSLSLDVSEEDKKWIEKFNSRTMSNEIPKNQQPFLDQTKKKLTQSSIPVSIPGSVSGQLKPSMVSIPPKVLRSKSKRTTIDDNNDSEILIRALLPPHISLNNQTSTQSLSSSENIQESTTIVHSTLPTTFVSSTLPTTIVSSTLPTTVPIPVSKQGTSQRVLDNLPKENEEENKEEHEEDEEENGSRLTAQYKEASFNLLLRAAVREDVTLTRRTVSKGLIDDGGNEVSEEAKEIAKTLLLDQRRSAREAAHKSSKSKHNQGRKKRERHVRELIANGRPIPADLLQAIKEDIESLKQETRAKQAARERDEKEVAELFAAGGRVAVNAALQLKDTGVKGLDMDVTKHVRSDVLNAAALAMADDHMREYIDQIKQQNALVNQEIEKKRQDELGLTGLDDLIFKYTQDQNKIDSGKILIDTEPQFGVKALREDFLEGNVMATKRQHRRDISDIAKGDVETQALLESLAPDVQALHPDEEKLAMMRGQNVFSDPKSEISLLAKNQRKRKEIELKVAQQKLKGLTGSRALSDLTDADEEGGRGGGTNRLKSFARGSELSQKLNTGSDDTRGQIFEAHKKSKWSGTGDNIEEKMLLQVKEEAEEEDAVVLVGDIGNVKRLQALRKVHETNAIDAIANAAKKKDKILSQDEISARTAEIMKINNKIERDKQIEILKTQYGVDSELDSDGMYNKEKDLEEEEEKKEPQVDYENGEILSMPKEGEEGLFAFGKRMKPSGRPRFLRADGLSVDIRARTVTDADAQNSDAATAAYNSLLTSGVLGKIQAERELAVREKQAEKRAQQLKRVESALATAEKIAAESGRTLSDVEKSAVLKRDAQQAILEGKTALGDAPNALLLAASGGDGAGLYEDLVLASDANAALLEAQKLAAFSHFGGLPPEASTMAIRSEEGDISAPEPLAGEIRMDDKAYSEVLAGVKPKNSDSNNEINASNDTSAFANDAVALMFARAKETAEARKATRLARASGKGYDPRRDPANVLRTDIFDQDAVVLAAPSSGIRTIQPGFGDGVFKNLWKGTGYERVESVKQSVVALVNEIAPNAGIMKGEKLHVTLPTPGEITGIHLEATKRDKEPFASESLKERMYVHEKRLIEAANDIQSYRYVGGVRFAHGDQNDGTQFNDTIHESMYGPLRPGDEQAEVGMGAGERGFRTAESLAPTSTSSIYRREAIAHGTSITASTSHMLDSSASSSIIEGHPVSVSVKFQNTVGGEGGEGGGGERGTMRYGGFTSNGEIGSMTTSVILAASQTKRNDAIYSTETEEEVEVKEEDERHNQFVLDHPHRTKEQILLAFETAAAKAALTASSDRSSSPSSSILNRQRSSPRPESRLSTTSNNIAARSQQTVIESGNPFAGPPSIASARAHLDPLDFVSTSSITLGETGYKLLPDPRGRGPPIILDQEGRVAENPPSMPQAIVRDNDPFKLQMYPGDLLPASREMSRKAQMSILLDKGDHNRVPDLNQLHHPTTFQNGYTSADVAEWLRIESTYAGFAEAEWLSRAGSYLENRASADDFVRAVRRRMQGKDPLTGILEPLPEELQRSADGSRTDVWDPVLVPLVRKYFSECYRTGLPPLYGSLTPKQSKQREELMELVKKFRSTLNSRVQLTLKEQLHERDALYAVPDAEHQAFLRARQDEREQSYKRMKINSEMAELQLEVRSRALRQHARMIENEKRKRDELVSLQGKRYIEAEEKAKERDRVAADRAEKDGLNPVKAMSRRGKTLDLARKLARGMDEDREEKEFKTKHGFSD
jgi:leucine-rich repeat protein SHOC2